LLPDPLFAAPLAGGLSIAMMFLLRCLHPPGGAVAMTAVLGGPAGRLAARRRRGAGADSVVGSGVGVVSSPSMVRSFSGHPWVPQRRLPGGSKAC
jgi:hypothetical protein